jgi:hypothetical protein
MVREAATLIMLLMVEFLLADLAQPSGYAAIALCPGHLHYVFLKIICGWPHSCWIGTFFYCSPGKLVWRWYRSRR